MTDALRVVGGSLAGRDIPVGEDLLIGREVEGPGRFAEDSEVSRRHARVTRSGRNIVLEDLGSTNGTWLNGWRIPAPQLLRPTDQIQIGGQLLEVLAPAGAAAPEQRSAIYPGLPQAQPVRPSPEDCVLWTEAVAKAYGSRQILHGVDLEVRPGEIVGLLGPNGAGKTTFVSIVSGLKDADAGTVIVNGVDALADPLAARRHLGIGPQDLGIYPTATVRRNLHFFGEMGGLRGPELEERVHEVAELLSLTEMLDRLADKLSGGQKRRLHTGMAMIHGPALLILDEPTVGADIRTRQEILDAVKLLASQGHGIVYSTHYLPEIEELGASVAILDEGRIVARGSIAELVRENSTPAVELHFDGQAPAVPGATVEGSVLRIFSAEPSMAAAQALQGLGHDTYRLRGIEILRPSLDSVYLTLTERRYSSIQAGQEPGDGQPPVDAYYGPGSSFGPLSDALHGASTQ